MRTHIGIYSRFWKKARVFWVLGVMAGVLFLWGCQVAPRSDSYVAAVEGYMAKLEQWDVSEGTPPAPPRPAYVQCAGFDTHPPALGMNPDRLVTPEGSIYLDYHSRPITNTYTYNCSRINSQRRKAYEAALQRYEIIKAESEVSY